MKLFLTALFGEINSNKNQAREMWDKEPGIQKRFIYLRPCRGNKAEELKMWVETKLNLDTWYPIIGIITQHWPLNLSSKEEISRCILGELFMINRWRYCPPVLVDRRRDRSHIISILLLWSGTSWELVKQKVTLWFLVTLYSSILSRRRLVSDQHSSPIDHLTANPDQFTWTRPSPGACYR